MSRTSLVLLVTLAPVSLACSSSGEQVEDWSPSAPAPTVTSGAASAPAGDTGAGNGTGGQDARPVERSATPRAFGASCGGPSDCDSDVCFLGGHGGFCTFTCSSDATCPANATGTSHCNPHGYCQY